MKSVYFLNMTTRILILVPIIIFLGAVIWYYFDEPISNNELINNNLEVSSNVDNSDNVKLITTIRNINFKEFLSDNEYIEKECAESSITPIYIDSIEYFDANNDNKEEAIIAASSCLSGTSGSDIVGVYGLSDGDKVIEIPVEMWGDKEIEGHKIFEGSGGHFYLSRENERLIGTFPIYKEGDSNCCPTGGIRKLYYRWNGSKFEVVQIKDTPTLE